MPMKAASAEKPIRGEQLRKAQPHSATPFWLSSCRTTQVDQREDEVDQHDDHADGRALAELEVPEGDAVVVDRQSSVR